MFSGHSLERLEGIGPGHQFVDLALRMAVDDAGDDIGEIGLRVVDGVELAGFDERGDDGPMLAAAIGAGEERILAIECDRPDGSLDDVVVDLDATVVEEAVEALPAREGIANGRSELGLLTDDPGRFPQPWLQRGGNGAAPRLPGGVALLGRAAADISLDLVKRRNPREASVAIGSGLDWASS